MTFKMKEFKTVGMVHVICETSGLPKNRASGSFCSSPTCECERQSKEDDAILEAFVESQGGWEKYFGTKRPE